MDKQSSTTTTTAASKERKTKQFTIMAIKRKTTDNKTALCEEVAEERRQKKRQKKTDDEEVPSWLPVSKIKSYFEKLRAEVNEECEGEDRDTKNEEMEELFREDLVDGDFIEPMADALQKYSETERKRKLPSDETSDLINDEIEKAINYFCKSKISKV